MRGPGLDRGPPGGLHETRFARVIAHGGIHLGELFGQLHRVARAVQVDAGLDDEADPGFAGVGHQFRRILTAVVQMGVGIDEHHMVTGYGVSGSRRAAHPSPSLLDARKERSAGHHGQAGGKQAPVGFAPGRRA